MLKRVEPLREELNSLELQAETNINHGKEVKDLIAQLEQSIAAYKEEYAQLSSSHLASSGHQGRLGEHHIQAKVDRAGRQQARHSDRKCRQSSAMCCCLLLSLFMVSHCLFAVSVMWILMNVSFRRLL